MGSVRAAQSRRPMARRSLLMATGLLLAVGFLLLADPSAEKACAAAGPIVFPLERPVPVGHMFFVPRSGHLHQGIDLLAPKMTKELAVVSGTVTLQVRTYNGQPWYTLWLAGDDGRGYYYSHINNDTPGTDDGRGGIEYAFAPGIETGSHVSQGQFLAYCGDSGNAENTSPHLHFDIHQTGSMSSPAVDPYDSLRSAPLANGTPAAPLPIPRPVMYEQTTPKVTYTGVWRTLAATGASGGSYAYAESKAEALVWFEGTGLRLVAMKSSIQGIMRVSVDDGPARLIDMYSPVIQRKQTVWSSGTLGQGTHTIRISWTGSRNVSSKGTRVTIDALVATGTLIQAPTVATFQETNSLLSHAGLWGRVATSSASGGSMLRADSSGATFVTEFSGIYAALIACKGPRYGKAWLTLDDQEPVLVDLYGPTTVYRQKVWNSGVIAYGTHTLKIEWSGLKNRAAVGTMINVDALQSIGGLSRPGDSPWSGPLAGMAITG